MKPLFKTLAAMLLTLPLLVGAADSIDINSAGKDELMQMSGVGVARAEAIIEYREAKGGFTSVEELTEVSGIGDATLEKNRDRLSASQQ